MNTFRRLALALLPLAIPLIAAGEPSHSPLIDEVRDATARYRNINVALNEGFVQATPCVSGPDHGAMGIHFLLPSRIAGGVLAADQPEALIYEPMANGALRFVGVEFIVLDAVWTKLHPNAGPPSLNGHLLNFIDAPNRYELPALWEMHVWAWERNPVGSFADWNTAVSCDQQPTP